MNFKTYRNKLTSSIRTSKAIYFSEAIKSGNNVGELWKHLQDINSVSKCHIKCIDIDGKKCDNIEDICNNSNHHYSSVAERIIKNSNLNASTEKFDNWVSSKLWLENTFSYTCQLPEEVLMDGPFNLQGGLWLFSKKNILIPNVAEKNILILVEEKNNNLIHSFRHIT